jgi:hypothetical protein
MKFEHNKSKDHGLMHCFDGTTSRGGTHCSGIALDARYGLESSHSAGCYMVDIFLHLMVYYTYVLLHLSSLGRSQTHVIIQTQPLRPSQFAAEWSTSYRGKWMKTHLNNQPLSST